LPKQYDTVKETNLIRTIMLALSKSAATRLFRNNVGVGWAGRSTPATSSQGLTMIVNDARPLHAGLCEGSSDLVGWHSVTITPDMVGSKVAIFLALEAKTAIGKASAKQINFLHVVRDAGGISGIARSAEEAGDIIEKSVQRMSRKN
jgi:hypothetical protein